MNGGIRIFDISKSSYIFYDADSFKLPIRSLCFSPDGSLLYACSDDRHVIVFDWLQQTIINSFSHFGMCMSIDCSQDNRRFVVGCADGSVVLWDIGMQKRLGANNNKSNDMITGVKWGNSNKHVLSVGDDSNMQFYNISQ